MENILNVNCIQYLTLLIALCGIITAIIQLSKNNKSRIADFTDRLDSDFFTENTRSVIELIDFKFLKFIEPKSEIDDPYFKIDKSGIEKMEERYFSVKEFAKKRNYEISTYEIDDYLLGHFEKIGLYGKKKIIDMQFLNEIFDYYIQLTFDDKEIQKYLTWIGKDVQDTNGYNNFIYIAQKLKKHGLNHK